MLPAPIAFFLGCLLVVASLKLLFYGMDSSSDKTYYIAFVCGFPFFCLGFLLIFFCLLPDPPKIFGISIEYHLSRPLVPDRSSTI